MVSVGDTAVFCSPVLKSGTRVIAPYLDNRAGCTALLQAMQGLESPKNDLYFVFTTQEEVGLRGAKPVAWALEPDYALVVDVTCPDDVPGALHEGTTALGAGAAIKGGWTTSGDCPSGCGGTSEPAGGKAEDSSSAGSAKSRRDRRRSHSCEPVRYFYWWDIHPLPLYPHPSGDDRSNRFGCLCPTDSGIL